MLNVLRNDNCSYSTYERDAETLVPNPTNGSCETV